jgi:L,D-transpeptidase catalytic domain
MTSVWTISAGAFRNNTPNRSRIMFAVATGAALLLTGSDGSAWAQKSRKATRYESVQSRPAGTPLVAIVALRNQRITIYDTDGWILRAPISSGQTGYETPAGIYSVIQKEAEHYSNLYDDASMPFMQRITWSGIALHAGVLPGHAASHGCVRMPYEFAKQLFDMTKLGMRVIVARNDVSPTGIAHPALFKSKLASGDITLAIQVGDGHADRQQTAATTPDVAAPASNKPLTQHWELLKSIAAAKAAEADAAARKVDQVRLVATRTVLEAARAATAVRVAEIAKFRAEAQLNGVQSAHEKALSPDAIELVEQAKADAPTKVANAEAQLAAAKAEAQPKAEAAARAREAIKAAEEAKNAALEAAQEATRRLSPVSVFISRKTQRLYVRQAFQPVLEMPVTIHDADQPIGTHIYTALDSSKQGADMRWNVISMHGSLDRRDGNANTSRHHRGERHDAPLLTDTSTAREALDRIDIPQDAIDRISELVSPGSSLIISDEGISRETGKGTDFVILMSGEPQGGISMRRRDLGFE